MSGTLVDQAIIRSITESGFGDEPQALASASRVGLADQRLETAKSILPTNGSDLPTVCIRIPLQEFDNIGF